MSRITPVAKKCFDLFWAYTRNEITVHEMNIELAIIEFKQLKLPYGKEVIR
jgi:hypothetical protein